MAVTDRQVRRYKQAFLEAFRRHGNVTWACREVGIPRGDVYRWKEHDTEFMLMYEVAEVEATETMEQEAYRRAVQGVAEPVFHQGVEVATVSKYSDTLLMFMLKGRAPEKYRETIRTQGTVTGPNGGPVEVRQEMNPDAMSAVIAAAEQAAMSALYGVASGDSDDDKHGKL